MKNSLLLLLSFLLFKYGMSQDFERLDPASIAFIENSIQAQMNSENLPGVSVGIIKNGEVVYLKGFGFADIELEIPATPNTMYRIASISKTFTAIAALQLWETNQLDLTADIRTYVPEYPIKAMGTITMEDLLSNESGMQHYSQQNAYDGNARDAYIRNHPDDYDPIAAIDAFKNQPLLFTPGSQYNYTTFGFNLAAAVVERAGNMPFEEQVQQRICQPAQMPYFKPHFRGSSEFFNQATGYRESGGNLIPDKGGRADYDDVTWKMGGGGWICSVRDLTHFMKAFVDSSLLLPSTMDTMGNNHDPSNSTNYGYGILTATRGGDRLLFHDGAQAWTRTLIYFSPENRNGVAIMTNNRNASPYPLARLIYDQIKSMSIVGAAYTNPVPLNLDTAKLQIPVNIEQDVKSSVVLEWDQPNEHVSGYDYEYWSLPIKDTIAGFSKTNRVAINHLDTNTIYYWRVRPRNDYAWSNGMVGKWSQPFQFNREKREYYLPLPFTEDFESIHDLVYQNKEVYHGLGFSWEFEQEKDVGRAKFGKWSITSSEGYGGLTIDAMATNGTVYNTNYVTLSMNLGNRTNDTNLTLDFDYIITGEESHEEDKVWIRGSSQDTFVVLYDWFANKEPDGDIKEVRGLDIDSTLMANGQVISNSFQIRFGQRDNSYAEDGVGLDGITLDNITVDGTDLPDGMIRIQTDGELLLYPNPSSDAIVVNTSNFFNPNYKVTDITGRLIEEGKISASQLILNVSDWRAGIYIFEVVDAQHYMREKFVVR